MDAIHMQRGECERKEVSRRLCQRRDEAQTLQKITWFCFSLTREHVGFNRDTVTY